jgi:hypothetical protein
MSMVCFRNSAARSMTTRRALACFAFVAAVSVAALPAFSQSVNLFPKDYQDQWTRTPISPKEPITTIPQWHIDPAKGVIVCDGNGGHDWLRFNKELHNFDLHAKWRFTKVDGPQKYNSGIFSATARTARSGTRRRLRSRADMCLA